MTKEEIKQYIKENQICIVTNSTLQYGSLFCESIKHYIEYCSPENFLIIPGRKNGQFYYGLNAFIEMITILLNHNMKYAIYIDEDCFVTDFEALIEEFKKFKENNSYCIAGLQDGGVICHRNHSRILVNTFLSFWNIDLISKYKKDYVSKVNKQYSYTEFINELKNNDLYTIMNEFAEKQIEKSKLYRETNYGQNGVPHCDIVKNDPDNPIEPHQVPYSYCDDTNDTNFESYYILEEGIILATQKPLYYLNANDFYSKEETKLDNSGMTSIILSSDSNKIIAYHTWFSRAYNPFIDNPLINKHTNRINKVIKNI